MLSYKEHQPRPGTVLGTRGHVSGVCMGLERGLSDAQILLANQPPTSRVPKELFTQGMMTNGKPKNHFIMAGATDVDTLGKLKAACSVVQPDSWSQGLAFGVPRANPACLGTRLPGTIWFRREVPLDQLRAACILNREPEFFHPDTLTSKPIPPEWTGPSLKGQPQAASEGA